VQQQLRSALIDDVEAGLRNMALLVAPHAAEAFRNEAAGDIQSQIQRLGQETGTRITLVLPTGVVMADSVEAPAEMENHGDRPEIVSALTNPFGVSRRFSNTLRESLLYVARAVRDSGDMIGVVRISIPLSDVDSRLSALRATVLFGAGIGVLVALAIGLVVAQRITSPISEMTEVAEAFGKGDYGRRVESLPGDEIGVLGGTLNRLAEELTRRIASLGHERARLGAMVAGMQEGVLAVDHEGRVVFCNRAVGRLLDVDAAIVEGQMLSNLAVAPELHELLRAAGAQQTPGRAELTVNGRSGDIVMDARATPFEADEEGGVVVVLYDITNLRRLEQIRTDFVANVSHELKTPLTSIKGYVETLLSGAIHDEENNMRFLGKIEDQVNRLTSLVSDLLSLAQVEASGEAIPLTPIDWVPLIRETSQRHEPAIAAKRLEFSLELPGHPVRVQGDDEALIQILDNLLDNAIKYTPEGGSVSLRLSQEEFRASLEVEDSGIGIPRGDFERIFERFYRVDKARSRELGGTGLGLSIVKHLVRGLRGEIRVESRVASGSLFTVLLPLAT
jgi:two-component system phosphate regulon sensor histidine kinase PhoR